MRDFRGHTPMSNAESSNMDKHLPLALCTLFTCSCNIDARIHDAQILRSGEHIGVGDTVIVRTNRDTLEKIISHQLITYVTITDCSTGATLINLPIRYSGSVSGDFENMRRALDSSPSQNISITGRFDVPVTSRQADYCIGLISEGYSPYRLKTNVVRAQLLDRSATDTISTG
jgi:hypothetical protein